MRVLLAFSSQNKKFPYPRQLFILLVFKNFIFILNLFSISLLDVNIKKVKILNIISYGDFSPFIFASLSKRFDFDKRIKSTPYAKNSAIIEELCEWIDTYQLSREAKYNIAIENIVYSFDKNKLDFTIPEVIGEVTKYFTASPVITDKEYSGLKQVLYTNLLVAECKNDLPDNVLFVTNNMHEDYTNKVNLLREQCENTKCADLIKSSLRIRNEKQASAYINKVISVMENNTISDKDKTKLMTSIILIPLVGAVTKAFVDAELKVASTRSPYHNHIEDKEFVSIMQSAFSDGEDLIEMADIVENLLPLENDQFSEIYKEPEFNLLESESFADSDDIKKVLDEFKQDQNKSIGRFKRALSRIYRKSPENIIDETPNILSTIRGVFIIGTGAIPIVGPALMIITAFVDNMIHRHINAKESEKLAKALRAEKDKVEKDIEKGKGDKDDLIKYKKCLETCIDKVEAYHDNLTDETIAGGDDDDDWGDDIDFDLEYANIMNRISMIDYMCEKSNIIDEAADFINKHIKKYSITEFQAMVQLVNEMQLCSEEYFYDKLDRNITTVMGKPKINHFDIALDEEAILSKEELDDINMIRQFYAIEAVDRIIHEEFNLNNFKLLIQNFKKGVKDLSTKEKSMWQTLDAHMSGITRSLEKALTSDRREAIIKGSIIPSFSKCIKTALVMGGLFAINPILGLIGAVGSFGASKYLNARERQLIYDKIETELKVVDKQLQLADNDGNMKQYRTLLQYQKKLERERQRIKYGMKVHGRSLPSSSAGRRTD